MIRLKHENHDVDLEDNDDDVHLILTTNKSSVIEDLVPGNRPAAI